MATAAPGTVLSFDGCQKRDASQFRPIEMRPLPMKKVREFRKRLRAHLNRAQATRRLAPPAIYDEVYEQGMKELDGEGLPVGITGTIRIKVDGWES